MRCTQCGWIVENSPCPCGATKAARQAVVPIGTTVVARPRRGETLTPDTRVWAMWLDGRWYPGRVDDVEGPLRHITWDDGDSMWLDANAVVPLIVETGRPKEGALVLA